MKTRSVLPEEIRRDVEQILRAHERETLAVYAVAEKIRQRWIEKNVALEDIIELLVEGSGRHCVAIAFNPDEARSALLGDSIPDTAMPQTTVHTQSDPRVLN